MYLQEYHTLTIHFLALIYYSFPHLPGDDTCYVLLTLLASGETSIWTLSLGVYSQMRVDIVGIRIEVCPVYRVKGDKGKFTKEDDWKILFGNLKGVFLVVK